MILSYMESNFCMELQTQAFNLYIQHLEEYTLLCKQHCKGQYRHCVPECLSEVLEWLPRIIKGYDPVHGLTIYQWSIVILRCKLPNYIANICSHDAPLSDYTEASELPHKECIRLTANKQHTVLVTRPKQSAETRIIVSELLSILRGIISTSEFELLWCRHVEDYKLNQLAYKLGLSTSQTAVKLERLEEYVRWTLNEFI